MGEIIYDFAKRKQEMEAASGKVRTQVSEAVQQERMRLAYERGRIDEREDWLSRRRRWRLSAAALGLALAFAVGWALAVSGA
jgi:hypothetical protein